MLWIPSFVTRMHEKKQFDGLEIKKKIVIKKNKQKIYINKNINFSIHFWLK